MSVSGRTRTGPVITLAFALAIALGSGNAAADERRPDDRPDPAKELGAHAARLKEQSGRYREAGDAEAAEAFARAAQKAFELAEALARRRAGDDGDRADKARAERERAIAEKERAEKERRAIAEKERLAMAEKERLAAADKERAAAAERKRLHAEVEAVEEKARVLKREVDALWAEGRREEAAEHLDAIRALEIRAKRLREAAAAAGREKVEKGEKPARPGGAGEPGTAEIADRLKRLVASQEKVLAELERSRVEVEALRADGRKMARALEELREAVRRLKEERERSALPKPH
jgi:hypothetical protein